MNSPYASPERRKGKHAGNFSLNIHATSDQADPALKAIPEEQPHHEEEKKDLIEPKTRAPGGVWI